MAFIVLPIRTESVTRRTPLVNYFLLGANVFFFLVLNETFAPPGVVAFKQDYLYLHAREPAFYQFFTYQFLHADVWHLVGNMLFLWLFGNGVNAKMGDVAYLMFYLGGGVFAGWAHSVLHPQMLLGASGSIAAVTTAYLALFPRSHVLVMVWLFLFIHFFEWPAMVLIGLKIIVWDNIVSPHLGPSEGIAHSAHLAGYLFGFVGALIMLLVRALPRDQFDILALWKRWYQRREFAAAMADPKARARAQFGSVANTAAMDAKEREAHERRFDEISDLKSRIGERMEARDIAAAAGLYEALLAKDAEQCLSERYQLDIAREFYSQGRFAPAAAAFERFVACYPHSPEAGNVRLLLGIIFARDLQQLEKADEHLSASMGSLRDDQRRGQCLEWLKSVRGALGRPAPEV